MLMINKKLTTKKQALRRQLRRERMIAAKSFSSAASLNLAQTIQRLRPYQGAKHIAVYLPVNHEFPTQAIIKNNIKRNKYTYIPRITSIHSKKMLFVPLYTKNTQRIKQLKLTKNVYGILEPQAKYRGKHKAAQALDIIFMPLLGFNQQGERLGMGGGYYDRVLWFKNTFKYKKKPLLIGLAYNAQNSTDIETEKWDVALDAVITEDSLLRFNSALL